MENKSRAWTLRAAAVLLILVLATVVWSSGLFARFVSFASGGDSARVAKFDFKVSKILYENENDVVTNVTDYYTGTGGHNIYVDPGVRESASHVFYEYTIENDSEVTVDVKLSAASTGNLPYRIYFLNSKDLGQEEKEYAKRGINMYQINYGTNGSKTITLAPRETRTVYLWMDWANVDNNSKYDSLWRYDRSYEIDQLTVTIDCRQVD